MASILGWSFYLSIALNIEWKILSAGRLVSLNSGICRFLTAFEKPEFKNFILLSFLFIILTSSTKVSFSSDLDLSDSKGINNTFMV